RRRPTCRAGRRRARAPGGSSRSPPARPGRRTTRSCPCSRGRARRPRALRRRGCDVRARSRAVLEHDPHRLLRALVEDPICLRRPLERQPMRDRRHEPRRLQERETRRRPPLERPARLEPRAEAADLGADDVLAPVVELRRERQRHDLRPEERDGRDRSLLTRDGDRALERGRRAARLDRDIGPAAVRELVDRRLRLRRVDRGVGAPGERRLAPDRERVDHDQPARRPPRQLGGEAADDALAVDDRDVADAHGHVEHAVERDLEQVDEDRPLGLESVGDTRHQPVVAAHREQLLVWVPAEDALADHLVGVLDREREAADAGLEAEVVALRALAAVDQHLGAGADERRERAHGRLVPDRLGYRVLAQLRLPRGGEPERARAAVARDGAHSVTLSLEATLQSMTRPPATSSVTPVTHEDASESRNSVALATSSGSPIRPSGDIAAVRSIASGVITRSIRSDIVVPGATQFARTPYRPTSSARCRVNIATPAFDAAYAACVGLSRKRPEIEDMVTIAPRRAPIIAGRNSRTVRNVDVRFASITSRHSASVSSTTGVNDSNPPANGTSSSTSPSSPSTSARIAATSLSLVQSPATASASPPSSATSASTPSRERPLTATRAPFRTSARHVAAPIPFEPPVTRATLPSRSG